MVENYGINYLDYKTDKVNYLVKKELRERIHRMIDSEPGRYSRYVDALFMDDICYFLCNDVFYKTLFKEALDYIYPQGKEEAREFLHRLISIRNRLSHSNPVSVRQAEQAVCYSHDFVEGLKQYYKDKGMEQMWNVPRIIRVLDSLGNVYEDLHEIKGVASCGIFIEHEFNCGDKYSVSIEVDSSFSPDEYDVLWSVDPHKHIQKGGTRYTITFDEKDVGEMCLLCCKIVSKKPWHRFYGYDFSLILSMSVLPPV
ncbi:MAG: hypothetical protein LUE88_07430 [Clostridiales bacterium]|nr:hypothetical protein [Clostridiales bacterium]